MVNEATSLRAATAHWLRHTGISDAINKYDIPIAHVRDDANLQARYESAKKKTKIKREKS